jgi:hypothetical protein
LLQIALEVFPNNGAVLGRRALRLVKLSGPLAARDRLG